MCLCPGLYPSLTVSEAQGGVEGWCRVTFPSPSLPGFCYTLHLQTAQGGSKVPSQSGEILGSVTIWGMGFGGSELLQGSLLAGICWGKWKLEYMYCHVEWSIEFCCLYTPVHGSIHCHMEWSVKFCCVYIHVYGSIHCHMEWSIKFCYGYTCIHGRCTQVTTSVMLFPQNHFTICPQTIIISSLNILLSTDCLQSNEISFYASFALVFCSPVEPPCSSWPLAI